MRLEKVLDNLNSFEKNSFLKIVTDIVNDNPANQKRIEKIFNDSSGDIKSIDNANVAEVFELVAEEFKTHVINEFNNTTSQFDILTDIITRDGNCLMKLDWFSRLYEKEIKEITNKVKAIEKEFENDKSNIQPQRRRDYRIYKACLRQAYVNDDELNLDRKITFDERSILHTLTQELELSQEEIKLINYMVVPLSILPIDDVITELKNSGVIFYSKKNTSIFVPDEVVRLLRKVRGKDVSDKYFRRVLKLMREPQINLICRKHNIDWKAPLDTKIASIIREGINFTSVLTEDMFKEGTTLTERKKILNDLCDKGLNINPRLSGSTLAEKVQNLIKYFDEVERDEKVGISVDGYDSLLRDLNESFPIIQSIIKTQFELQEEKVMVSNLLLDYNIKPRDVLELLDEKQVLDFCKFKGIKTRGEEVLNILEAYKDSDNLLLENYRLIGERDIRGLKDNGIAIKEADLGVKFEEITKRIFQDLGFTVDEELRKSINTKKDKADIILNLGNNEVIIVECKTSKDIGYNKFSTVSRQLRAYVNQAKINDLNVTKSLLVAPDFSDDFVSDCEVELELNLSLIRASSLLEILKAFKKSKHKILPDTLLRRDVLIQEDRIIKAISK